MEIGTLAKYLRPAVSYRNDNGCVEKQYCSKEESNGKFLGKKRHASSAGGNPNCDVTKGETLEARLVWDVPAARAARQMQGGWPCL